MTDHAGTPADGYNTWLWESLRAELCVTVLS